MFNRFVAMLADQPAVAIPCLIALVAFWVWFGLYVRRWFLASAASSETNEADSFAKAVGRRYEAIGELTDPVDRFNSALVFYAWVRSHQRRFETMTSSKDEQERRRGLRLQLAVQKACPRLQERVIEWISCLESGALQRLAQHLAQTAFDEAVSPERLAVLLRNEIEQVRHYPRRLDDMLPRLIMTVHNERVSRTSTGSSAPAG